MKLFKTDLVSLFFPSQCMGCQTPLAPPDETDDHPAVSNALSRIPKPTLGSESMSPAFKLPRGRHWCHACWKLLGIGSCQQCIRCSAQLDSGKPNPFQGKCAHCFEFDFRFDRAVSLGNYAGLLRDLVVAMKNRHDDSMAIQLGRRLADVVVAQRFFREIDCVIPVPIHWRRRLVRGFCAPEIIAETLGTCCQLKVETNVVQSIRLAKKQGQLSLSARKTNVSKAFSVKKNAKLKGRTVLIVDDVMTSGATCNELTRVIKSAGAQRVYVAVIARATGVR